MADYLQLSCHVSELIFQADIFISEFFKLGSLITDRNMQKKVRGTSY